MSRRDEEVEEVEHLLVQHRGEVPHISHHEEPPAQHDPHAELPPHGQERRLLRFFIGFVRSRRG